MVDGKLALVRDIDYEYKSVLPDGTEVTNYQLMQKGNAPIDPITNKSFELHHVNQEKNSTLAILTKSEHQGNAGILNQTGKTGVHNAETGIPDSVWAKQRAQFWKSLAKQYIH